MPLALAFGNSHIGPYVRGHRLALADGRIECDVHGMTFDGARYEPLIHETDSGKQFNPAIIEDIRSAIDKLAPNCLITAVVGSDHWKYGLINNARPFDFITPALPQYPMSPGTELIPYDLLARRFYIDLDWQFNLVRAVRKFCDLPILHIEAPPPVESVELMLKGIFGPYKESMEQLGCPAVSFRYKIWWIWTDVARKLCAELGLPFVEGPPDTRDAKGFLDARYCGDGLHGTDEYGAVMACEVVRVMRSLGIVRG
jgi:hypothetical protein